ncbi:MAG: hypothetical protein KGI81_05920 [Betaproteobacteria bacterium]|nr:hypothetical protein [Betaproteobacteria bacterium]
MSKELAFVACVNDRETLGRCLLASPCLAPGQHALALFEGAASAAQAFNAALSYGDSEWLVYVHQDVFLPPGWEREFLAGLATAQQRLPQLAVAGVFGVGSSGLLGHVVDRGRLLREGGELPAAAHTLDELCFAVRRASGIRLDPALGFDFYAADAALQAHEQGLQVAVVDACCEHRSTLPRAGFAEAFVQRFAASATAFQHKWRHRLPVTTPCITLTADSPAEAQVRAAALRAG